MASIGISDVVTASVYSEKTSMKKLMMMKIITPLAQRERGNVIDRGVHIYIYICLWSKKNLNRTLEIDSPQTLTVGLLVEFID